MERLVTPLDLPDLLVEPIVRAALHEDLGRAGDLTTMAVVPAETTLEVVLATRQPGVVAGLACARLAWQLLDPSLDVRLLRADGDAVRAGDVLIRVRGGARAILTGERVALNFVQHLSGVASATRLLVEACAGTRARVTCTRKTTPGLRAIEKAAVRAGGGVSHRFGLDDGILIKDNHLAVAGGVREAVARARAHAGHMVKVEVEVESLAQLDEALAVGVDAVLLDNMPLALLAEAVTRVAGRVVTEASGGITPATAPAIAATGVDLLSVGWLTHSAPALDVGLDVA
jgi:nicotinate-nucleotide pyrophosphorylase (carboxylating)